MTPSQEALTDADIKRIHDTQACLPDLVGLKDQWPEVLRFARACIDADRKARQQEALDALRYRMKRNIDERNFKESNIYKHSNEALRDMLLDGWRASYDTAIDAAIAKG